jgi:DNA polymerase-1
MSSKRLLIIDMLNMFYRAYIVDPSLSTNGAPIGGLKGTIKILQKLIRESNPDKVVVCWDGAGGSRKRRSLKKDYKAGRKPIRLNRSVRTLSESEEVENKFWQQGRLIEYINNMPIAQLMYEDIEADDIIAFIKSMPQYKDWQKVIISSDKDFFQLLDENTILHRPVQKEFLSKVSVLEKFEIHPNNFAVARAIAGDKSDNLPGIPGAGLTTVKNRFPFLKEEKYYTLKDIMDHCKENLDSKAKIYERIIENEDTLKLNYKMMQLYAPSLSANTKRSIKNIVLEADNSFNKTEILKLMIQDGFGEFNWSELSQRLNKISIDN